MSGKPDFDSLLIEAKSQNVTVSSSLLNRKAIRRGVVELDEASRVLADDAQREVIRGADESLRLLSEKNFDPEKLSREVNALTEFMKVKVKNKAVHFIFPHLI